MIMLCTAFAHIGHIAIINFLFMLQLLYIIYMYIATYIHTCSKYYMSHCNSGYLKPVYVSEGKVSLILFTAQLGSATLIDFPSQLQHHRVS